jgi:endonuclease YncB( thermonuclease family)
VKIDRASIEMAAAILAGIVIGLGIGTCAMPAHSQPSPYGSGSASRSYTQQPVPMLKRNAVRVIDGDTIVVDGTHIRLHGIDAPELDQWCGDWQAGRAAKAFLERLIANRPVTCTPPPAPMRGTDQYKRTIAVCRNIDAYDLGRAMVVAGQARAYVRYSQDYAADEAKAKSDKLGLWAHDCQAPWDFRHGKGSK